MDAVAVALSGGVDSSVAALLLWREGRAVSGGSFVNGFGSRDGVERARRLCARLGLRHYLVEEAEAFRSVVLGPFAADYRGGRTPNPCVLCNREIKFGRFADELERHAAADGLIAAGARFGFATGHYARVLEAGGRFLLARARDGTKDQSYMLYRLSQEQLSRTIFPLGDITKADVRTIAAAERLEAAGAAESQDACFVDGSYVEVLRSLPGDDAPFVAGEIRDLAGSVLGRHHGYAAYTVGQRQGLGLGSGPWYVARIDPSANVVYVGRWDEVRRRSFAAGELNWITAPPTGALDCTVKVRYRSADIRCRAEPEADRVRIQMQSAEFVTPGQSAVFYDGEHVLGGGLILGE